MIFSIVKVVSADLSKCSPGPLCLKLLFCSILFQGQTAWLCVACGGHPGLLASQPRRRKKPSRLVLYSLVLHGRDSWNVRKASLCTTTTLHVSPCEGETVKIICDIDNGSPRTITPKVKLLQKHHFYTVTRDSGPRTMCLKNLASVTANPIVGPISDLHCEFQITIPTDAAATISNCRILEVENIIEVGRVSHLTDSRTSNLCWHMGIHLSSVLMCLHIGKPECVGFLETHCVVSCHPVHSTCEYTASSSLLLNVDIICFM